MYVVTGMDDKGKLYWNHGQRGWYVRKEDATKFTDANSANNASEIAEMTITVEAPYRITIEKA